MRPTTHRRRPRSILLAGALCAALALPASAGAATVSVSSGTLTYTAAAGEANDVTVIPSGGGYQVTEAGTKTAAPNGPVPLTAGAGCAAGPGTAVATCGGVPIVSLRATLVDGADRFDSTAVWLSANVDGGAGADRLATGAGADTLTGGPEDDVLDGGYGWDVMNGGGGSDVVSYASHGTPVTVTLDGTQNDGSTGEFDNVGADVENVTGGAGDDTLTGNGADNVLTGGPGRDSLNGGGGNDTLSARDGEADQLLCGAGMDGGSADRVDTVAGDCESVDVPDLSVDPGLVAPPAAEPTPPVIDVTPGTDPAPTVPAATNSLPPVIPRQTASVSASGVALVHIVCPAGSGGCKGTVTLELPAAVGHPNNVAAARRRMTRVGQAKFAAKAGTAPSVRVHLSRRGRQHMLRGIKARVGRVDVTTRSADGKAAVTSQSITLRPRRQTPPKRKPPKRGHK